MPDESVEQLRNGMLALEMDVALKATDAVVNRQSKEAVKEAVDAVTQALQVVGKRFQDGEWFLSELVYAGEIAKEVMARLSPLMPADDARSQGTVVVGTVAGDLHDLGKNIFVNYARTSGFRVIDLGIDVPAARFVSAVKEHQPLALGLSCLLTSTEKELGKVVEELKKQGVRGTVKVVIGGAALSERSARNAGADAFAPDAITGLDMVKQWSAAR
jgi:methanogenic corrinoid protein MtbC1